MLKKYIGSKQFYSGVWFIAMPILVQNVISNFVSLLDNIMVGAVGTEPMTGVSIVNQLIFVFNLGVWGLCSGIGILTAQYHGKGDSKGVADTFRMKIIFSLLVLGLFFFVFINYGDSLIWTYLHEGNEGFDLNVTFGYAKDYLQSIMWGLPFFLISQIYASTLRDTRETKVPMIAGLVAVFVNLVFNYLLIYGKFGFPCLGIVGAAIATNISRIVETSIIVIYAHTRVDKHPYMKGIYKDWHFGPEFTKKAIVLTVPSFVNEILWSFGQTTLNQCLSLRGVEVVSAINISNTVTVVAKSFFLSMGIAIAIIVGNILGTGDSEKAIDTDRKLIFISGSVSVVVGLICLGSAKLFPLLYNTTDGVRSLAATFIAISAILMPVEALTNACYHTIKSGGRPFITFMFDGGYTWIFSVPLAFVIAHYTNISIVPMYWILFGSNIIKLVIALFMVGSKFWARNIVNKLDN